MRGVVYALPALTHSRTPADRTDTGNFRNFTAHSANPSGRHIICSDPLWVTHPPTMSATTVNNTPNAGIADPSNEVTESFAVPMSPGHARTAAAQVFNTSELLELILSKLELKDILLRTQLTCRGFNTSIKCSPTIDELFETTMVKLMTPGPSLRLRRFSQTIGSDGNYGRHMFLEFTSVGIERLVLSPSFRKLRVPLDLLKRARWWLQAPGGNFLTHDEYLPGDLDPSVVTIADLLERIVERTLVERVCCDLDVVELSLWFE